MTDAPNATDPGRDPASAPPDSRGSIAKATTAGRLYWALAGTLLVLLLTVVFVAQNGDKVKVNFLWLHGHMALGLALLFAAVIGGLLTVLLATVRILQLRRRARQHERGHRRR